MYLVASTNAIVGLEQAMALLRNGATAVDAVETAIRAVEANADDHSVGYGGYPNLIGEVELDAGLMQGADLTSGSVAALKGYKHPISVARKVMEYLPHVLLVGDGAARFAAEMGYAPEALLTDTARETWAKGLKPEWSDDDLATIADASPLWSWVELATDPERTRGTTNVIAQDAAGHLCVGVSTSGWAWKYPGRVGDSPIVGAGFYADDRCGAAACTGTGEMAIRAATAHSVVLYIKMGLSLIEAGHRAMQDLNELGGRFLAGMNFIAVDSEGNHAGFSSYAEATYLVYTPDLAAPATLPRTYVPLKQRWDKSRKPTTGPKPPR
ncbi:MAG: N(4)-(beta-N-acetylglucosaminyl)-L-asparaginase [Anaerolineae bacterium]|nr:N(4)-(beta-N-acetylglucosaminyl)-L-asparaginase [Anaerolineae bacterium]